MLNKKLQAAKDYFGISTVNDWRDVRPAWLLAIDGIGPKTVDYLRLLLAQRGLTLKDDRTPEYWAKNLDETKIVDVLGNEELEDDDGNPAAKDRGVVCPYTVLIDTAEQSPMTFQGLRTSAADGNRPLIVHTEFVALGRFPESLGDYSLDSAVGGVSRCHVERKSMDDAHATILGFAKKGEDIGRRDRFEQELERLSEIEAGLVVVECTFPDLICHAPQWGRKSAAQNALTLQRSVLAYQQDYAVPWAFCQDRRHAEKTIHYWLDRWYRKQVEARKAEEKRLKKEREKLLPLGLPPSAPIPTADAELASIF